MTKQTNKVPSNVSFADIVAAAIKSHQRKQAESASKDKRKSQLGALRTAEAVKFSRLRSASSLAGVKDLLDLSGSGHQDRHEAEIRNWLTMLVSHGKVELRSTEETVDFSVQDLTAMTVAASKRDIKAAIAVCLALGDPPAKDRVSLAAASYLRQGDE
jgi:hypothetical protein